MLSSFFSLDIANVLIGYSLIETHRIDQGAATVAFKSQFASVVYILARLYNLERERDRNERRKIASSVAVNRGTVSVTRNHELIDGSSLASSALNC